MTLIARYCFDEQIIFDACREVIAKLNYQFREAAPRFCNIEGKLIREDH